MGCWADVREDEDTDEGVVDEEEEASGWYERRGGGCVDRGLGCTETGHSPTVHCNENQAAASCISTPPI